MSYCFFFFFFGQNVQNEEENSNHAKGEKIKKNKGKIANTHRIENKKNVYSHMQ